MQELRHCAAHNYSYRAQPAAANISGNMSYSNDTAMGEDHNTGGLSHIDSWVPWLLPVSSSLT